MTNSVLTFNLMLSTDESLIQSAMALNSFKEVVSNPRFKNSKAFKFYTLKNGNNLVSFTYEMSKEHGSGSFMLEFLDYDGTFEYNFISSNINDYIVAHLNKIYFGKQPDVINPFTTFYISFGTGSDFADWVGPFAVEALRSHYEYTPEAVKKIIVTFVTDTGHSRSILNKIDRSSNMYKGKFTSTPITNVISSRYKKFTLDTIPQLEADVFDGKAFSTLIKEYIKAYTGLSEVVILIPDMSPYMKFYNELKTKYGASTLPSIESLASPSLNALREFCSEFGLLFDISIKSNPHGTHTTNTEKNNEDSQDQIKDWEFDISMRVTTEESNQTRGGTLNPFVDGYIPLQKMSEGLHKLAADKSVAPYTLGIESEKRILDTWKSIGLISDSSKPVVVWGRQDYLINSLYPKLGQKDDSSDLDPKLRSILDKSYVDIITSIYGNNYNSNFRESIGINVSEFLVPKTVRDLELNNENIKKYKIPLFKSNLKNPNVTTYEFQFAKNNIAVLQSIVEQYAGYAVQNAAELVNRNAGYANVVYNHLSKNIVKFLDKRKGGAYSLVLKNRIKYSVADIGLPLSNPVTQDAPLLISSSEIAAQRQKKRIFEGVSNAFKPIAESYDKLVKVTMNAKVDKVKNIIYSNNFETPTEIQQKMNYLMSNFVLHLTIRTLPFFDLTGYKYWAYPCVFLQKLFKDWVSPMSGIYAIFGIKHVVTADDMYSEFFLTREAFGNSQETNINKELLDRFNKDSTG